MNLIIAIIQPNKLEEVKEQLNAIGFNRLTVINVEGYGEQKGQKEIFRGREYEVEFTKKIQLEIAVKDNNDKNLIVETIANICRTGNIGDGKIFVIPLEETIRIRTGEKKQEAI